MKLDFVKKILIETMVDGILLSSFDNRYWFTSFLSSAGYLFINKELKSILLIDGRYFEKAKQMLEPKVQVKLLQPSNLVPVFEQIKVILSELNIQKLGIEEEYTTLKDMSFYKKFDVELIPFNSLSLREIKTEEELDSLQKAANIAALTIEWIKTKIKPSMTEKEVANMISIHMLEMGAEKNSFDPIVASGINSSNPHHKPTDKKIELGDMITVDIGCIYNGYCSDITRSFILGNKPNNPELIDIYNVVLNAQLTGIEKATNNISGKDLDLVCRNIINKTKYKNYFSHGTGHGVGILVHEEPYVSAINKKILNNNNVITIEPGIYVPGIGGVRIEDTIVIKDNKPIVLTRKASKELYAE